MQKWSTAVLTLLKGVNLSVYLICEVRRLSSAQQFCSKMWLKWPRNCIPENLIPSQIGRLGFPISSTALSILYLLVFKRRKVKTIVLTPICVCAFWLSVYYSRISGNHCLGLGKSWNSECVEQIRKVFDVIKENINTFLWYWLRCNLLKLTKK